MKLPTLWRLAALLAVVAVAVGNVGRMAQTIPPPPAASPAVVPDPVMRHEQRFAALRRNLDMRGLTGTLGYFSGRPHPRWTEEPRETEEYYLTQFALAPRVLDPEPAAHEWAVANLPVAAASERAPEGWQVAQDFGDGVFLLHRTNP